MPKIGNRRFKYDKKGKAAAKRAARKAKGKEG